MGNKRGCPTCAGIDPKSCLRCAGKTKLSDWQATDNTAVIQALEKRIAELEKVKEFSAAVVNELQADNLSLVRQLAELEAAIRKHKQDCKMNYMQQISTVSPEDATLWALLGGGENG